MHKRVVLILAVSCAVAWPRVVAAAGPDRPAETCSLHHPNACQSDLRPVPISGPALHGYLDRASGLWMRIDHLLAGRVTVDEGCSGAPQFQANVHVVIRNSRSYPVTFDLVGLTLRDQAGHQFNPFGWSGPYPSHATPLGPHKIKAAWIPYDIQKPTMLVVRWSFIYPRHATPPRPLARYRVVPTGLKTCTP